MSCKDSDDREPWEKADKVSRTVLVYMAGENNLTLSNSNRFLWNDLSEIIEGSKLMTDDQRLLVFIDSLMTNKNDTAKEGKGLPCIVEVHGGKMYKRHTFDHEFYSSDPAYFRQILQWMTTNATAEEYGLVLWGHATGWAVHKDSVAQARVSRGYGQDDGSGIAGGKLKWMNITQMAKAMEGLPKLSFIFADCCLMMNAEVGYELRNATEYLIGSPAEIPGDGAPYQKVLPYFFKKGSELYKGIIDTYYDYYTEEFKDDSSLKGYSLPLSVIDTRYIENLAHQTHDILATFTPQKPEIPVFDGVTFYWYYDAAIMYDMKAFIKTNASEEDFTQWEKAYNQAVPYYRMSMRWMTIYNMLNGYFSKFDPDETRNGCVSMFIPKNQGTYYNSVFKYNSTYKNMEWNKVLEWERFGW